MIYFSCLTIDLFNAFVALDEGEKLFYGFLLWDVFEDTFLAAIERDAVASCSHVAVVGVCHLTRSIDDAAHDGYFEARQMCRVFFYFRHGFLEVKHRSSATRAGDILRFIYTHARGLEDVLALGLTSVSSVAL